MFLVDELCVVRGYRITLSNSREKRVFAEICTTKKLWDLKMELR